MAVVDLGQARILPVWLARKAHGLAHDLHRFSRAQERARHEIERGRVRPQCHAQTPAVFFRLRPPRGVERDVALSLIAQRLVPVGFAVTDEVERDVLLEHQTFNTNLPKLPPV